MRLTHGCCPAHRLALAAALTFLAGCSGDGVGGEFVNARPLHPDTIVPELVASWGALDGPDELLFTRVNSIAVDPRGRLIVHDVNRGVRWFEPDGRFIGYLARFGEGPREVRYSQVLTAGGNGEIAVWDMGNRKVLRFDSTGTLFSAVRHEVFYSSSDESGLVYLDDGSLWYKVALNTPDDGLGYPRATFVPLDPSPGRDTIFIQQAIPPCADTFDGTYRRGYWEDKRAPWFPVMTTAMGPDGAVAWACSDRLEIQLQPAHGPVRTIRLPHRALPISNDERRFYASWQPLPELPSVRPDLARIILPGNGWVWLWPTQLPQYWVPSPELQAQGAPPNALRIAEYGAFEVIDPDGRWFGTVALPPDVRYSGFPTTPMVFIRGDSIWAVRKGSLDEDYISKYVVRWP